MTESTLLSRLRTETEPQHKALEATLGLMDAGLTLAHYQSLLQRFHAFWYDWQPLAHGLLQAEGDLLTGRDRTPLLEQDLDFFSLAPLQPDNRPMPVLPDADAALGSLYVMEGSTLGGQVIARHLERCLGLANGNGYRYFQGYGPRNGAMWAAMRGRLALVAADSPAADRAVTAAAETFGLLRRRLG